MHKEKGVFSLFILFLGLATLCESRVVSVPAGPLVRVEGQSVAIRCNVSDYQGPRDQEFEWALILDNGAEVQLISTFDPLYPDTSVKDRVNSGGISIKKLSDASVELIISKVRASDSATYRCSTPSTDSVMSGNYHADVELRVIGDTLRVVPSIPQPAVSEGEPLELQCNASRAYTAHTFLSITWSIRKETNTLEDILTFGPDSGVKAGQGFAQRYADGGLLLDLREGGFYGLVMKGVKPSDQGAYVCTAREWTRQPGGGKGWHKILEKSEEMGMVTVTPLAQSLVVSVEKNITLNVEDTLNLTCLLAAHGLLSLDLELTWLVRAVNSSAGQRVLIHVGRDGQVLNGSELVGMSRVKPDAFRLILPKVQRSDSGLYFCQVKAWLPQGSGRWYQAAEKTSDPVQVLVTRLDPEFKVTLTASLTPQFTSDPTEMVCQVTNLLNLRDGQLSVSWTYAMNTPGDSSISTIASINEHGVLVPGEKYRQQLDRGDIAVTRSEQNAFRLRMLRTRDEDMGFYSCIVTAWTPSRQAGWDKAKEIKSDPVTVQWKPKTPVLSVVAHRVREASTGGSTFEMSCRVTGQNLQNPGYSVLIRFEDAQGQNPQKILSLNADSVLQLEEGMAASRTDSVALEKMGQQEYRFRLYGVQVSDRGFYCCEVTAWTRDQSSDWSRAVSAESNKIEIAFADSGPVFNVSIHSDRYRVLPGDTAKMECILSTLGATPNTDDVAFDVRWFQSPARAVENGGAVPLISMDRWGVVKKSGGNESTECSLERTDRNTFVLSVHRTQDRDIGEYYCTAKPWYILPDAGTWRDGPELTSAPVILSMKLALWDSLKMPVLYGVVAALGIGALSILLGLLVANCCLSRNPMHTPRSKLMDLEID
ncbi:prostaglandin F2 receptor negative regulator [Pygocentrus nattereri]|uniref:Ig-like domain-containing protein n=1 Tax=Pygocentrus nattereri TaxID=42514 RepID=A0A3B4CNZ6_PYGNA|nr:prostaglandin F2 receptor negative regulator [Pygocentrus nattereri]